MGKTTLSHHQTAQLCRGFSVLLHAGVNTGEGAYWLAEEAPAGQRQLLLQIGRQLESGSQLSDALEAAGVFPSHVTGLVRSGEESGRLEEALDSLARYYEARGRTANRLKSAVAYPSMLFVLMLAVIAVLLIQVLPVFDDVYASLGGGLTGISAGLLRLGQWLKQALPVLLGVLAAVCALAAIWALVPRFRDISGRWLRSRFGDRGISRRYNNARFAQVLAMGLRSGLPMENTLTLAAGILSDVPSARQRCLSCIQALEQGEELPQAMERAQLLSGANSRLFALGLRGGSGETVMEDISRQLQEDADEALDAAVSRVEPAMVLTGSILVGFILLSVMLPLMNILSAIG